MDIVRTLAILKYRKVGRFKVKLSCFKRELAIWNMVCVLAKHHDNFLTLKHAPKDSRRLYLGHALVRYNELRKWVERHPAKAQELAAPLIAEWAERAKKKQTQPVTVGA